MKYGIRTAYLFSSAITYDHKQNSDIDILISFKDHTSKPYPYNNFASHAELEKRLSRKVV